MRLRPSPSTMLAAAALLVSLSGGAYAAASQLVPRNSVGTAQVIDRSLLARDFRAGQLRPGPAGPPGAPGAPGTAGIAQIASLEGPAVAQCAGGGGACQVATSTASCPAGSVAVGGGFVTGGPDNVVGLARRGPAPGQYTVISVNFFVNSSNVAAHVICASGPGVSVTGSLASRQTIAAQVERLRRSVEASTAD